jgi:hypothetical protein
MKRVKAAFSVLLVGHQLSKPGAWKSGQLWGSLLIALIGLAEAFGFLIQVSDDAALGFSMTTVGLINAFVTVATTKKIGVPAHEELPPIDLVSRSEPEPEPEPERVRDPEVPPRSDPQRPSRFDGWNG